MPDLTRRAALEGVGTAILLAAIVGSGIMAQRLTNDAGLALLCNAVATGAVLVALIAALAPFTGAHFNPLVTAFEVFVRLRPWRELIPYGTAQLTGAVAGVMLANAMFGKPLVFFSQRVRSSPNVWLGEIIATFGLIALIGLSSRARSPWTPVTVGAYITGAYWFTSSTSFANPVVTVARSLSDTFAGIRPFDVPAFLAAQIAGAAFAIYLLRWSFGLKSVLFVCVHNSARSQMAEAFANSLCPGTFDARSAGLKAGRLNPFVIDAMNEIGIDISAHASKSVDDPQIVRGKYDYVVTVCDEASAESCPVFPGDGIREHLSFPDPSTFDGTPEQILDQVRGVRDAIRERILLWCGDTGGLSCGGGLS